VLPDGIEAYARFTAHAAWICVSQYALFSRGSPSGHTRLVPAEAHNIQHNKKHKFNGKQMKGKEFTMSTKTLRGALPIIAILTIVTIAIVALALATHHVPGVAYLWSF
jgi:hypothetical protein